MAVWPIAGHYYPNLAVAGALRARGHEVAFVTGTRAYDAIVQQGFECFTFTRVDERVLDRIFFQPQLEAPWWKPTLMVRRRRSYDWMAGLLDGQLSDVDVAVDRWRADVVVCDPTLWGPILVLPERRQPRLAVFAYIPFCPVPGPNVPPLGFGLPLPHSGGQRLRMAAARLLYGLGTRSFRNAANGFRHRYGLAPIPASVSEYAATIPLYLVAGIPELDFNRRDLPPSVRYVGACLWQRPRNGPPPKWLDERRCDQPWVHVSEGTIHTKAPLLSRAAAQGLAGLPMQVILSTSAPVGETNLGTGPIAPNIQLEHWLNLHYADLLPRTDLVVTTGGAGTVVAALGAGVPVIIAPTEWDKPDIAARVVETGAGLRLPRSRCTARTLRDSVERVLGEPSYRTSARRLSASLARHDGPNEAARLLEALSAGGKARRDRAEPCRPG